MRKEMRYIMKTLRRIPESMVLLDIGKLLIMLLFLPLCLDPTRPGPPPATPTQKRRALGLAGKRNLLPKDPDSDEDKENIDPEEAPERRQTPQPKDLASLVLGTLDRELQQLEEDIYHALKDYKQRLGIQQLSS
ncbi:early protein 4 [Callithrix penicillata papillomavirus type 2]|uniref:Early protein 4 n=1 Tax=Callithrix penicillata papillomavirus type 2 TaxID=2704504 RepID=A0A6C0T8D4_9PAPI|nr:early protein 4 [Callithrix penicillata papillomavirus type 2]